MGLGTGGLGAYAKYANPRWARGKRDFNTILGKKLSSPVGYAATTGIGFTVTPLAYSEEYRKRYNIQITFSIWVWKSIRIYR